MIQRVKNLLAMQNTRVRSLGQEDPWKKEWQPTAVFLPGESHGQSEPGGYSPWGHKESDMTEQLTHPYKIDITNKTYCIAQGKFNTLE